MREQETDYESVLREVAPLITLLENELRDVFVRRRASRWDKGHRSGKRIDVQAFIQEEAKDISISDTKMFMKHELPHEEDYAIEILVDLSGSMRGSKIKETFKAVVVLTEVLNTLGVKISVTGFNDHLIDFQKFDENYDDELRSKMIKMLDEVDTDGAQHNDDGWAVKQVSDNLIKQEEKIKLLFVLSDGEPAPSEEHESFDLNEIVDSIAQAGKVRVIGLGIGSGTQHVNKYYKEAIANVNVREFAERFVDKVKSVIEE